MKLKNIHSLMLVAGLAMATLASDKHQRQPRLLLQLFRLHGRRVEPLMV